jgi:hypothetical protein
MNDCVEINLQDAESQKQFKIKLCGEKERRHKEKIKTKLKLLKKLVKILDDIKI